MTNPDYLQDIAKAKAIFTEAADGSGHPEAQFYLGFLHATGTQVRSPLQIPCIKGPRKNACKKCGQNLDVKEGHFGFFLDSV